LGVVSIGEVSRFIGVVLPRVDLFFIFLCRFAPKMKRVGKDNVTEQIVPRSIVNIEGGIHMEIVPNEGLVQEKSSFQATVWSEI
jgi:hypothetical protein